MIKKLVDLTWKRFNYIIMGIIMAMIHKGYSIKPLELIWIVSLIILWRLFLDKFNLTILNSLIEVIIGFNLGIIFNSFTPSAAYSIIPIVFISIPDSYKYMKKLIKYSEYSKQ